MRPSELESIYRMACETKGFEPNDGQFGMWKKILGWCERNDLEQALSRWFAAETKFPMPAELRAIATQVQRERIASSSEKRYMVMFRCATCGHSQTGFLLMEDRALRFCRAKWGPLLAQDAARINGQRPQRVQLPEGQTCGAQLQIVMDDRLAVFA